MSEGNRKPLVEPKVVNAFRQGDERAFEEVYRIYFKRVYFFVYNSVSDKSLVDDVVQNTFVSAFRSAHQIRHINALSSWLMRIAFCESKNIYRGKRLKEVDVSEQNDLDILENDTFMSASTEFEKSQLYMKVYDGIDTMSTKLKEVAVLKYMEELSEEEISKVLMIPIGTVKSRCHKVRNVLQRYLEKENITPKTYQAMQAVALPTLITSALVYVQSRVSTNGNEEAMGQAILSAENLGKLTFAAGTLSMARNIAIGIGVVGSISIATYVSIQQPIIENGHTLKSEAVVVEAAEVNARIEAIEYNKEYTNSKVTFEVKTSDQNYDQILVNGNEDLNAYENGTYTITLLKDGKEIDKREVIINNIDKEAPYYTSYEKIEDEYVVYVGDNYSGIDTSDIQYYKNGELSKDFYYNQETKTIHFKYDEYSSNIFEIHDLARNKVKVTLKSKYV